MFLIVFKSNKKKCNESFFLIIKNYVINKRMAEQASKQITQISCNNCNTTEQGGIE